MHTYMEIHKFHRKFTKQLHSQLTYCGLLHSFTVSSARQHSQHSLSHSLTSPAIPILSPPRSVKLLAPRKIKIRTTAKSTNKTDCNYGSKIISLPLINILSSRSIISTSSSTLFCVITPNFHNAVNIV